MGANVGPAVQPIWDAISADMPNDLDTTPIIEGSFEVIDEVVEKTRQGWVERAKLMFNPGSQSGQETI